MHLLTLSEAAREARVSVRTLYEMRRDGLPTVRLRGRVLIDRDDLSEWVASQKVTAVPDPDVLIRSIREACYA